MGVPEDLRRCGISGYAQLGCALAALGGIVACLDFFVLDVAKVRPAPPADQSALVAAAGATTATTAATSTAPTTTVAPETTTTRGSSGVPGFKGAVSRTLAEAFQQYALAERKKLEKYSEAGAEPPDPKKHGVKYQMVEASIPLQPPFIKHDPKKGEGQGDKNIVGLSVLGKNGNKCVVYGMGIATDSSFEQQMAKEGCETHAFDCTVDPKSGAVAGKSFTFHHWCIGKSGSEFNAGNEYAHGQTNLEFKTLQETMKELGHTTIDLLKFDIEGFEWRLFESELLTGSNLPAQLSFELHAEGAAPHFVPPANVKGKNFVEVNQLFLKLFDAGYRVVSKEVNRWDPACAEFVMVNVNSV